MTTKTIVLPPSKALIEAAGVIETALSEFLDTRDKIVTSWGKFESETEALNLFYLIIRHAEAISLLARTDMVHLPSALTLARTAFEIAVRILWLLHPTDPFEREIRWLALVREDEEFHRRAGDICAHFGADPSAHTALTSTLAQFREDVAQVFPPGYAQLKEIPSLRGMLANVGREARYVRYMELSQFSHGTHAATWTYRRNLGIYMEHGEFITAATWFPAIEFGLGFTCRTGSGDPGQDHRSRLPIPLPKPQRTRNPHDRRASLCGARLTIS